MAADGSVVIEITGDAGGLIQSFKRIQSETTGLKNDLNTLDRALKLEPGNVDLVADKQRALKQSIEQTTQSLTVLEAMQKQAMDLPATAENESYYRDLSNKITEAKTNLARFNAELNNMDADRVRDTADAFDDAAAAARRAGDDIDRASKSSNKLGGIGEKASKGFTVLKGVAAGFVANLATSAIDMAVSTFVDIGAEALNAADSMQKFNSTMQFAGFDTAEITASKKAVQKYAADTAYDLETVANTTAQLAANGIPNYVELTQAAGNLNAVAGGNAETFKSVSMMLTQTAGAGKLTTENWNQLTDAIPGASGKLQEAMLKNGAYTGNFREAMEKGEITAEEFNQALMDLGFEEAAIEAANSTDTIEGAVGALRSTLVDGLTNLLTDGGGLEAITGFINGINSILMGAGELIKPAIDSIRNAINGIRESFESSFTEEQRAAITGFLQSLAEHLVALPFQAVALGFQIISTAISSFIEVVGWITNFFSNFGESMSQFGEQLSEFGTAFVSKFQEAGVEIQTWGSGVLETISTTLGDAVDRATEFCGDFAEKIGQGASDAAENVETFLADLPENAQAIFDDTIGRVLTWAENFRQEAYTAASGFLTNIGNTLASLPGKIYEWISGAIQSVITWGQEMRDQAQRKMEEVARSIENAVSSIPNTMLEIGRNIVQGLINGIQEKIGAAKKKAEELAGAVMGRVTSLLRTNSPSKWAIEIGEFVDEGLGIGLENGVKYAEAGATKLANVTKLRVAALNDEIERMETEAAKRQEQAELEAHEKALAEKYKQLEDAELDKRASIQEAIDKLNSDWAEKQLKKQEDEQKAALKSRISSLEATQKAYEKALSSVSSSLQSFNDEYTKALEDVSKNRDSLAGQLSDFDLYDEYEGKMKLWDIGPMIEQIERYGDTIAKLKERGVNQGLLSEILDMDREEAVQFGQELLKMSESQYSQYMEMWQQKEDVAAKVAEAIYQGDVEAIEAEYAEKLPGMMEQTATEAMQTLAENLEEQGKDAIVAASRVADQIIAEVERIAYAQRLSTSISTAVSTFSGNLTSSVQSAAEGKTAERRSTATEIAGASAFAANAGQSREIVLSLNGREMARGLVPDIRAVEDQSPRIVSD